MKKLILFMLLAALALALFAGCTGKEPVVKALTINDIARDPFAFTGEIVINGVVSGFGQDEPSLFGLMDTEELIACKNFGCGAVQLPVIYVGDQSLPQFADEINITGSFISTETEFYFEATEIDVKRNIMNIIAPGQPIPTRPEPAPTEPSDETVQPEDKSENKTGDNT